MKNVAHNCAKHRDANTNEILTFFVLIQLYWIVIYDVDLNSNIIAKRMFTAGQEVEKDAAGSECVALD
jgi:hypothetical protein